MVRGDQYLSIGTNIKFMRALQNAKYIRGFRQPPLVRRVTKIRWLDEGLIIEHSYFSEIVSTLLIIYDVVYLLDHAGGI